MTAATLNLYSDVAFVCKIAVHAHEGIHEETEHGMSLT